jgi:hypothetical protein
MFYPGAGFEEIDPSRCARCSGIAALDWLEALEGCIFLPLWSLSGLAPS